MLIVIAEQLRLLTRSTCITNPVHRSIGLQGKLPILIQDIAELGRIGEVDLLVTWPSSIQVFHQIQIDDAPPFPPIELQDWPDDQQACLVILQRLLIFGHQTKTPIVLFDGIKYPYDLRPDFRQFQAAKFIRLIRIVWVIQTLFLVFDTDTRFKTAGNTEFEFERVALFRYTVVVVLELPTDISYITFRVAIHMCILGLEFDLSGRDTEILDFELANSGPGNSG